MDPQLLRTFVAVAEHGSFSAAAAQLCYTRSPRRDWSTASSSSTARSAVRPRTSPAGYDPDE